MTDILQESAKAFNNVTNYDYMFTVARSAKKFRINLSCLRGEFAHIIGLEHLKDIPSFSTHKTKEKLSVFQNILAGNIAYTDIEKSALFSVPFPNTYNSLTKAEYTMADRITSLSNIESILDNAHSGKLYTWNKNKAAITTPNGRIRRSQINADYMLSIPSGRNPDEKIYLFMYQEKSIKQKDNEPIRLNVFSAFPECLNLSQGQERPYTILEEAKYNIATKQTDILFTHPSYQAERDKNLITASQNIVKITTASHIVKNSANQLKSVELSTSGAAVLAPPNPMKEFFDFVQETVHIVSQKITNFFSPQHKPSHTQNTASNQNKG